MGRAIVVRIRDLFFRAPCGPLWTWSAITSTEGPSRSMFTGIISDVGQIAEISSSGARSRLKIASAYDAASIAVGASIANAGVCLTAVGVEPNGGLADRFRRRRGDARGHDARPLAGRGTKVNLERALRVGDELGGHMVSGHVDGIAEILSRRDFDGMAHLRSARQRAWRSSSRSRGRSRSTEPRSP